MAIPMFLTSIRLLLVPVVVSLLIAQRWVGALCVYSVALLTDVLDGYLARKLGQQTTFGATLDPLVDKLMNVSCLYVLTNNFFVPFWFFMFVCVKEVFLLLGALYICFVRPCVPVGALFAGKFAGFFQGLYIIAVFVYAATGWLCPLQISALLYVSFATSLYALIFYGYIGVRGLYICKK